MDLLRLALMPAVITIHMIGLVRYEDSGIWQYVVLAFLNGAVPALFVISGYFLRVERKSYVACIVDPLRRLVPVHLFWMLIYYILAASNGFWPALHVRDVLSGGIAYHLWFLPSLAVGLVIVGTLLKLGRTWLTWPVLVALTAAGLVRGSYHEAFALAGEGQRSGLIAAPLLVGLGAQFRRRPFHLSPAVLLAAATFSLVAQYGENALLAHASGSELIARPFAISTYAMGGAIFLLGRHYLDRPAPQYMLRASQSTLGIYALHVAVFGTLISVVADRHTFTIVTLIASTFLISSLLAQTIAGIPVLRRVVC
jgi:surface polysaccharide O-acyltransferase-like enzyme